MSCALGRRLEVLWVLRFLIAHFSLAALCGYRFVFFGNLERTIPIFAGEDRVSLSALIILNVGFGRPRCNPFTQTLIISQPGIKHGYSSVCLIVVRMAFQHSFIIVHSFMVIGNIFLVL